MGFPSNNGKEASVISVDWKILFGMKIDKI